VRSEATSIEACRVRIVGKVFASARLRDSVRLPRCHFTSLPLSDVMFPGARYSFEGKESLFPGRPYPPVPHPALGLRPGPRTFAPRANFCCMRP
jgi:hypothetical protein